MSYTPGPWYAHGGWGHVVKSVSQKLIAVCFNPGEVNHEESLANMALISAAPEMLSLLQEMVVSQSEYSIPPDRIAAIHSVIEKAIHSS